MDRMAIFPNFTFTLLCAYEEFCQLIAQPTGQSYFLDPFFVAI